MFEKSRIPKSIEDFFISIRQRRHIASWRENSTSSVMWQEKKTLDELRVHKYHEKMQDRFNIP